MTKSLSELHASMREAIQSFETGMPAHRCLVLLLKDFWRPRSGDYMNFDLLYKGLSTMLPVVEWPQEPFEYERSPLGLPERVQIRSYEEFKEQLLKRFGPLFDAHDFLRQYEEDPKKAKAQAEAAINHANTAPPAPKREIGVPGGNPGPGRGHKTSAKNENGTRLPRGSNRAAYRTARLARDHPEIVERQRAGEFKNVADAERAAGIRPPLKRKTPIYTHWDDVEEAAAAIRTKLGEDFARQLKEHL